MKENDLKHLVVKGNTFIEGRYQLSITAHKLLLALIAKIDPTKVKIPEFRISEKELIALDIGVSEKTVKRNFTDACIELLKLHVHHFEKDTETGELDEISINVFAKTNKRWTDLKRTKLKEVRFKFSSEIMPYLSNFKEEIRYTKYLYKYVRKLPSSPTIRLYELLRRWRNIDEKKPVIKRTVDVGSLRYMLGIEPDMQTIFANFKKNILVPAMEKISDSTDIRFEFKDYKANRSRCVTHIKFQVYDNNQSVPVIDKPDSFNKELAKKIAGLVPKAKDNDDLVYWYFTHYPTSVIKDAISEMAFNLATGAKVKSPAGYLKALCEGLKNDGKRRTTKEQLADTTWQDDDWFEQFEED